MDGLVTNIRALAAHRVVSKGIQISQFSHAPLETKSIQNKQKAKKQYHTLLRAV